jgi:hypothetical protein
MKDPKIEVRARRVDRRRRSDLSDVSNELVNPAALQQLTSLYSYLQIPLNTLGVEHFIFCESASPTDFH